MTLGLICRPYSNYYNGVLLLIIHTTVDNCRIILVECHLSLIPCVIAPHYSVTRGRHCVYANVRY